MRSRKPQIILQGMVLCLRWSYTCAWKSSPGPFHHLAETTRIKFQADFSLLQNLYIQTYILYTLFLSHENTSLCRGQKRPIFRGEFGIICHYFFLLSSSPWQRWQVLVLFMTPNINDLLLYLCLFFFLLDSNLCVPYAYIHVVLKCAFACYKKKKQFNWVSKVLN